MTYKSPPILFISYARYELATVSFAQIKKIEPQEFYWYSNTSNKIETLVNIEKVQSLEKQIDWPCNIHKNWRAIPLDIYTSLRTALDWFYENVKEGIVVEEDVMLSVDFVQFVNLYRNQFNFISSNNYFKRSDKHMVSTYPQIYGWYLNAKLWRGLPRKLEVPSLSMCLNYSLLYGLYFYLKFKRYQRSGLSSAWDIILFSNMIKNSQYALIPKVNLGMNMGVSGHHQSVEEFYHNIPIVENNVFQDEGYKSGVVYDLKMLRKK